MGDPNERILKMGQSLANILTKVGGLLFWPTLYNADHDGRSPYVLST